MVFQKKGATAVKNVQPKKKGKKQVEAEEDIDMFDDMDDSDDFEDDSDEDMPVQKTPQNKTPKGRQSLSEKKVTFNMSAKNTPAKTPNKNNSLVGKKTPTPAKGKGGLQEFKGIKGGKPQQKKGQDDDSEDDDDDNDDDDEDDDLDLEMDEGDDMDEGGDEEDDDDDDDDEDDDDDDDDEEDSDEEEEQKPNQKQANKQKNNVEKNQKTPVKNENAKNQTPKAKTPKNEIASPKKETSSPQKNPEIQSAELQRRKERDARTLYLGNLPQDTTAEEVKALSPDITNVIIPRSNRKVYKTTFAFLCFASEAKAEANFKTLQSKKFRGQLLNIDYVGEKSTKKPKEPTKSSVAPINERKLYVTGIPTDATLAEVAEFFPKAFQISFNKSPSFRTATVNFEKTEDANEAFDSCKDAELNGAKLVVVHSTVGTMNKKNKNKRPYKNKRNSNAKQGGNPAKKMKFTKKEKSSDEE